MTWDGGPARAFTRADTDPVLHLTAMRIPALGLLAMLTAAACQPGVKSSKDGAVLFDTTCVQCHARDGRGAPAFKSLGVPDLTDPAIQGKWSDEQMMKVIQDGSQNRRMPPWRGVYSEEQIRALVTHVRSLKR